MQALIEFLPLVAFLLAYRIGDIYIGTATLIAAMAALLVYDRLRQGRIPPLHLASAALVFVLGGATLVLRDERFIVWKPTVLFVALAIACLGSLFVGRQTLIERLMTGASAETFAHVRRVEWVAVTLVWSLFYALLAVMNLWVAWNYSQSVWVNFKVFGVTGATLAFVTAQTLWLARRSVHESSPPVADTAEPAEPVESARAAELRARLCAALEPDLLEIRDDSALHAGHAGAREGGHYHIVIGSAKFRGLAPLARHRLVYAAVGDLMGNGVHALSIDARLPS